MTVTVAVPGPLVPTHDGHTLTTTLVGPAGQPRVVLQHGVGSSVTFLVEAVCPPLVAAGWQVVAADLRGHGQASPVPDVAAHALSHIARDVGAVAAATGAVAVGGVSLGGHAAVAAMAAGHLTASTRLVAALPAWLGSSQAGFGPHAVVAGEVRTVGVAGMIARLEQADGLRPWLRRVLLRDLAASDPTSLAAALVALDGGEAPSIDDLVALPKGLGVVGWPDDPGHPLSVARAWAMAADGGVLVTMAIDDLDEDPHALGRAMLAALGHP